MLASARVAMALLFAVWVALDPAQPALAVRGTVAVVIAYLLVALALLGVARTSWWYEHRLAVPAFAVDALVFLAGLYATEAVTLDLFSVFITFFAFLVLASAARWSERTTEAIAGLLVICFLLAGLLVFTRGAPLDLPKFIRRLVYLLLLATLLIWFARARSASAVPRLATVPGSDPVEQALDYAITAYGASCGIAAWLEDGALRPRVLARPDLCGEIETVEPDPEPVLYDRASGRRLALVDGRRPVALSGVAPDALMAALPESEGLSIPIAARTGRGRIVLGGIRHLSSDDLLAAPAIAAEIARAVDDEATAAMAREVAIARLRTALAADLHDGVAQTLAGVQFRLKALSAQIPAGTATTEDVESIARGVAAEQQHLRAMIDRLRRGTITPGRRELREELLALAGPLAEQWEVGIDLDEAGETVLLPTADIYQVRQIVREAVANAVRHGQASRIAIELARGPDGGPVLAITDNGSGCATGDAPCPRSILERTTALGGRMTFVPAPGASQVRIELPGGPG